MTTIEDAFRRWCLASEMFGIDSVSEKTAWKKLIEAYEREKNK